MSRGRGHSVDVPLRAYPLPPGVLPLGLSRTEAACLVGVSTTTFDLMVKDGRMPRPKRIGARTIWDRTGIERAFFAIAEDGAEPGAEKDAWSEFEV